MKKSILLVEDEIDLRTLVAEKLNELGFAVTGVGDGEAALDFLRKKKPDLVISDVVMPKMQGDEFIRAARGLPHGKDVPFIVLTARVGIQKRFDDLNIRGFLEKPFHISDLSKMIEDIFPGR
jgi:CheY-like chemotaxis protein